MSETANFAKDPRLEVSTIGSANVLLTGGGVITTVFTAGVNGSRIDKVSVKSISTNSVDNMVRFFLKKPTATAWYLFTEIPISTLTSTVSNITDEVWQTFPDGLSIPVGFQIGASTHNANYVNVTVYAGDF